MATERESASSAGVCRRKVGDSSRRREVDAREKNLPSRDEEVDSLKANLSQLSEQLCERDSRIEFLESRCRELEHQLAAAISNTPERPLSNGLSEGSLTVAGDCGTGNIKSDLGINDEEVQVVSSAEHGLVERVGEEVDLQQPAEVECRLCSGRIGQLELSVRRLESALQEKVDIISSLTAENMTKTAEILEVQQLKLQNAVSEKDSAIAVLELRENSHHCVQVKVLKAERSKLVAELKRKAQERLKVFRKESDDALSSLAVQYQDCSKDQVCGVLRRLDLGLVRLKRYIDQLLALLLEHNASLLEGLPRIQQSNGIKPELLSYASITELIEELSERECDSQGLQDYASLLLQRVVDHAPELLESVVELGGSGEILTPYLPEP